MIVQSYRLKCPEGQGNPLQGALHALAQWLERQGGCTTVHVLQDQSSADRMMFLELWRDETSRKAAGTQMPGDLMKALMDSLDEKPSLDAYKVI